MNTLITTACILSASTLTLGTAAAMPTAPLVSQITEGKELTGVITSVSEDGQSFEIRTSDGVQSVKVDENTTFMLDGERSERQAALKAGRSATVQHDSGLAKMVNVTSEDTPNLF